MNIHETTDILELSELKSHRGPHRGEFKYDVSSKQFGMSSSVQFDILKNDIKKNGQLVPIIVWRGMICDGRNRCKALDELGIDKVKVHKLPHKMSEEERMELAKRLETTRRHQTATQLACVAAAEYARKRGLGIKVTLDDIIEEYPTSKTNLSNANWLYKNEKSIFMLLFDGKKIKLNPDSDRATDSLTAIVNHYKEVHRQRSLEAERLEAEERANGAELREDEDGVLMDGSSKADSEYAAIIALANVIIPIVSASQKVQNFDVEKFFRITLEYMRDEGIETMKVVDDNGSNENTSDQYQMPEAP